MLLSAIFLKKVKESNIQYKILEFHKNDQKIKIFTIKSLISTKMMKKWSKKWKPYLLFYPIRYDFLHVFLQNLKHVLFFLKTPYYDDHQIFNIEKKLCKSYFEAQISRFSRFFALFTKVVLARKNQCYPRRDNIFF